MKRTTGLLLTATALTLNAASGQVTPIDQFTGDHSDDFEGRSMAFGQCVQNGVFGGQGQLCSTNAFLATLNSWVCQTTPRAGGRFFISTFSEATYTFSVPIARFGGYFAGGHPGQPGATVEMYAEDGSLIEAVQAAFPVDCTWHWQGWSSATPVSQIVVRGRASSSVGGLIGMDDMQIAFESGAEPCYADCNTSTGAGVLDLYDVLCFQEAFLSDGAYACDADTSTGAGVCDILDFIAYMDSFLEGCEPNDPPASVPVDLEKTTSMLKGEILALRTMVLSLDDSVVKGRNLRVDRVMRWGMAWRLSAAHDALTRGDRRRASEHLRRFLMRVDGVHPRWDWVEAGPEGDELAHTAGAMITVIDLLRESYGDRDRAPRRSHWRWGRR